METISKKIKSLQWRIHFLWNPTGKPVVPCIGRPIGVVLYHIGEQSPENIVIGGMKVKDIIDEYRIDLREFKPYLPIKSEWVEQTGTEVHYLSYYLRWDPQECYYYASEYTRFQANEERTEGSYSKYSSIDDKIDPLHYWTTLMSLSGMVEIPRL